MEKTKSNPRPHCDKTTLVLIILMTFIFCIPQTRSEEKKAKWIQDFSQTVKKGELLLPKGWELKTKTFTPATKFFVEKNGDQNILCMEADKSTGTLLMKVSDVDLEKTPIMRWRWRVLEFPKDADGREKKKDDQAVGIYLGWGRFSQSSLAYRWETVTPKGEEGKASYGAGMVSVKWFCVRDEKDGADKWYVDERNVYKDFKKTYDEVPNVFGLSVVCNSQYTGSKCKAEVAWIEFVEESKVDNKNKVSTEKTKSSK